MERNRSRSLAAQQGAGTLSGRFAATLDCRGWIAPTAIAALRRLTAALRSSASTF